MWKLDKIILILIAVVLCGLFISFFGNIFIWLILSVFVCILGLPIMNLIEKVRIKKFSIPKVLAATITLLIICGIITLFVYFLAPLLTNEIAKFQSIKIETLSEKLENPIRKIEDFVIDSGFIADNDFSLIDFVVTKLQSLLSFKMLGSFINNLGGTIVSLLLGIFSVVFISFFFLKDKATIIDNGLSIVSEKMKIQINSIIKDSKKLLIRFFYGILLETLFFIIFCTIGFLIIGLNFNLALLISILVGVLNIIPYLGPIIAALFGLVLVTIGNLDMDFSSEIWIFQLKFLAIVIVAEVIDRLVLSTIIYSKSVKAHPVEIYLVVIVAGSLWGIVGMIFAIPVYTIVRVIAKTIIKNSKQNINKLENENI